MSTFKKTLVPVLHLLAFQHPVLLVQLNELCTWSEAFLLSSIIISKSLLQEKAVCHVQIISLLFVLLRNTIFLRVYYICILFGFMLL